MAAPIFAAAFFFLRSPINELVFRYFFGFSVDFLDIVIFLFVITAAELLLVNLFFVVFVVFVVFLVFLLLFLLF